MKKPCRLELNNSGAWKVLGRFDCAIEEDTDDILDAAGNLVDALNAAAGCAPGKGTTLRVTTDDSLQTVLMRYDSRELGWRDPKTREPV